MKKFLTIITLTAFAAVPATLLAAPKKEAAAPAAEKPAEAKPAEAKPAAVKAPKPMPFSAEVTTIDAAGKSFTHKNKDGTEVKFVVTETTEIKNGEAAAKLEDIKVGDTVSGSRLKKSDTEYEVVKITKFGVKEKKERKEKKAEKKAEAEKKADAPAAEPAPKKAK